MYIIIPSYEPDYRLVDLVEEVQTKTSARIIVVNDGSGPSYQHFFELLEESGTILIEHSRNKGKGAALKTAFNYIKEHSLEKETIITIDSDGQHLVKDMLSVEQESKKHPEAIILGARSFVGDVPFRSRFGNKVTAILFRFAVGQKVTDTQTGLRAFSTDHLDWLLNLDGERFEYEFNMLLEAKAANYPIKEVPIETIYLEENESSHFRPIQDSIRIYAPFLKFIGSSVASSLVDIAGLLVLMAFTKNLLLSVVVSRVISSAVQCYLNANVVFNKTTTPLKSVVRYASLVVILLCCNYLLLNTLVKIGIGLLVAKIVTEGILFLLSYRVQKTVVFV